MPSAAYKQMRKWNKKHPRGGKAQYMGFSTLGNNERRREPWLGHVWFDPEQWHDAKHMEEERKKYILQYKKETERMLLENPNLIILD